jgi:hypothetical protein
MKEVREEREREEKSERDKSLGAYGERRGREGEGGRERERERGRTNQDMSRTLRTSHPQGGDTLRTFPAIGTALLLDITRHTPQSLAGGRASFPEQLLRTCW